MTRAEIARSWSAVRKDLETVLSDVYLTPMSAICLVYSPMVGLVLWLVLLQQPALALTALIALSGIEGLSIWRRRQSGGPGFGVTDRANGLLSALAGAWIFLPAGQSAALTGAMIALTILTGTLFTFLAKDLVAKSNLPALVWPYCLIAFLLFTIFPEASPRSFAYFEWPLFQLDSLSDLPDVFLRSMGVFLFSPWPLSGLLIAGALLAWSPAMFLAGMTGWLAGVAVSAMLVATGAPIYWAAASYNFFLAGAALGAVFFVPDVRGLLFAALGGALAALIAAALQVLFAYSAASFLPIPFAMTLYIGLVLLAAPPFGTVHNRITTWADKPERNRITIDWLRARWGAPGTPLLGVPLQGALQITQGFDGPLSHRGDWRHALDFQRPLAPAAPEETRAPLWGAAVFSPVAGTVKGVVGTVPDNPPGTINLTDNWGNHVILETASGDHVMVGHLMQNSLQVVPGQTVGFTTGLGLVGNSGRSTLSHLHLHAQTGALAGSPTCDFRLANYFLCAPDTELPVEWHASGHVGQGDIVMAAAPNPDIRTILSGILPGRGIWTQSPATQAPPDWAAGGPLVIETGLLDNGHYMIRQGKTDWISAALEFDAFRLTAHHATAGSLLSMMAMPLSTIPYAAFPGLIWNDWLPHSYPSAMQRYLGQMNPLQSARIDQIVLRCAPGDDPQAASCIIMATPRTRAAHAPVAVELTLAAQRGPVKMVVHFETGTRIYQQISFKPHAR